MQILPILGSAYPGKPMQGVTEACYSGKHCVCMEIWGPQIRMHCQVLREL